MSNRPASSEQAKEREQQEAAAKERQEKPAPKTVVNEKNGTITQVGG